MQSRLRALSLALIILTVSMSGCLSSKDNSSTVGEETPYISIFDRHTIDWKDNHTFSYTLETGPHLSLIHI